MRIKAKMQMRIKRSKRYVFMRDDFNDIANYDQIGRVLRNLVHASDSVENANREIDLWFSSKEVYDYKKELDKHF